MKSLLKTLIKEIYKVDKRNNITFIASDGYYRIGANGVTIFGLSAEENAWCCGIVELGDTIYQISANGSSIAEATEEQKNEFYVRCMNQIAKLLKKQVEDGELSRGLATWTHTTDNPVTVALLSEFGIENSLWRHKNTFFNPNSGNSVALFTVDINPDKEELPEAEE